MFSSRISVASLTLDAVTPLIFVQSVSCGSLQDEYGSCLIGGKPKRKYLGLTSLSPTRYMVLRCSLDGCVYALPEQPLLISGMN